MKEKDNKIAKEQVANSKGEKMTRKEAIKKTGYVAASAATMMLLLNNRAEAHGHGGDRDRDRDRDRNRRRDGGNDPNAHSTCH